MAELEDLRQTPGMHLVWSDIVSTYLDRQRAEGEPGQVWTKGATALDDMWADPTGGGGDGPSGPLVPVQLAWDAGSWKDASGTVYDSTAIEALRPCPIYWRVPASDVPEWTTNPSGPNQTYFDAIQIVAAA